MYELESCELKKRVENYHLPLSKHPQLGAQQDGKEYLGVSSLVSVSLEFLYLGAEH